MPYTTLLYTLTDGVAEITLNRPEKRNALSVQMMDRLIELIKKAEGDDDVKVVILKGNGPCFCAGRDLADIGRMYGIEDPAPGEKVRRPPQRNSIIYVRKRAKALQTVLYSMKTTIAQVHKYCLGVGLAYAQMCDLIIASDDTEFGHPEQKLGGAGTTWTLINDILTMGPKKARELSLTGRRFYAEEAERLGIINKVVPKDKLDAEVNSLAESICLLPRDGLAIGKAYTHLAYDTLGMTSWYYHWYATQPQFMGQRWESDEFNWFKARRDKGLKASFEMRDSRFPDSYK